MSIRVYAQFKELYNSVKPIRGRAVDVRPIGDRRRDNEQVICRVQSDGQIAYGAQLYSTDVFLVLPNGDLIYDAGFWNSHLTAEFTSSLVRGINVFKRFGRLWLMRDVGTEKFCALLSGAVRVKWDTTNPNPDCHHYRLEKPTTVIRKMADPVKLKVARAPIQKFKDYVTAMLKMSDGVVGGELIKTHITNPDRGAGSTYSFWHSYIKISGENYRVADAYSLSFDDNEMGKLYGYMSETDEGKCMELYPKLLVLMALYSRNQAPDEGRYLNIVQAVRVMDKVVIKCNETTREVKQVITKPVDNCLGVAFEE
jgi:hypothetical protein